MKLLPNTASLYCVTFSGVIITSLVVSRSDYFRNFVDSCLQKIAQDRPTSDVLLKVRGIKKAVWCWTWERAEACHCLFVRGHLSDHAWGNLKCKYSAGGRSKSPIFPFQPHWQATSHKIVVLFFFRATVGFSSCRHNRLVTHHCSWNNLKSIWTTKRTFKRKC